MSGLPVKPLAVLAIPTTSPIKVPEKFCDAVKTPEIVRFVGNLSWARIGSLALSSVPRFIFPAST